MPFAYVLIIHSLKTLIIWIVIFLLDFLQASKNPKFHKLFLLSGFKTLAQTIAYRKI